MIVSCRPRWRNPVLAILFTFNVLLVASSGTWGQSKNISLEMLGFVRQNPEARFVTDPMTYKQMVAWNEFRELPDVCVLPCLAAVSAPQRAFLLYNPLNQPVSTPNRPPPASLGLNELRCSTPVLTTQPKPRLIAAWLPFQYLVPVSGSHSQACRVYKAGVLGARVAGQRWGRTLTWHYGTYAGSIYNGWAVRRPLCASQWLKVVTERNSTCL